MDPALRHAWTEIISADDYETHMAAIGQAQAAASLTEWLLTEAIRGRFADHDCGRGQRPDV